MSNTNTGGPAFPHEATSLTHMGMTLRDYFAAKAMQAVCHAAVMESVAKERESAQGVARAAYTVADAMLKARAA